MHKKVKIYTKLNKLLILIAALYLISCDPTHPISIYNKSHNEIFIYLSEIGTDTEVNNDVYPISSTNRHKELVLSPEEKLEVGFMIVFNPPNSTDLDIESLIIIKDNDSIELRTQELILSKLEKRINNEWGIYIE